MHSSSQQLVTCPTCGAALEETFGGGGGCMFCLLQAGISSEEETLQDSAPDALGGGMRFGVYEIDCHADGSFGVSPVGSVVSHTIPPPSTAYSWCELR